MFMMTRPEPRAEGDDVDIGLAVRFSNSMGGSGLIEEQKTGSGSDEMISKRNGLVDDMPVTAEVGHAALPYG